jgi:hypothetical protein
MSLGPRARRVLLAIAVLLFLGMTWSGVSGGLHQISQSRTTGQWIQTVAQLCYGVLGLLCVPTSLQWRRWWSQATRACWVVSVTLAAGFAAVAWGGTSVQLGVLSGAVSLLIAVAMVWLLRTGFGASPPQGTTGHP